MAKENKKYWEVEEPKVSVLGINQFRYYEQAGKLQVFRVKEGAPRGVTKGCTIELDNMSDEELKELAVVITEAIKKELSSRAVEDEGEKASAKKKTATKKTTAKTEKKKKVKRSA